MDRERSLPLAAYASGEKRVPAGKRIQRDVPSMTDARGKEPGPGVCKKDERCDRQPMSQALLADSKRGPPDRSLGQATVGIHRSAGRSSPQAHSPGLAC
ncbi:MAG TPA: hypothetical protein VGF67_07590 [Ktedonobacteraceae bacterium]